MKGKRHPPSSRRITLGDGFQTAFRKLSPDIQEAVLISVRQFRERSAENSLRPEKKAGLKGVWAFRVNLGVRVFYIQRRDNIGIYSHLFHVCPHDDYREIASKHPKSDLQTGRRRQRYRRH